jgi:hypothetical protein
MTWWSAEGCECDRARQAARLRGLLPWPREDVYAAMIRCTADESRVDRRTRSKWSRVLRYVEMQKDQKEPFAEFIKRKGGTMNARCGTADASGDLPQAGDQLRRGSGVRHLGAGELAFSVALEAARHPARLGPDRVPRNARSSR